MTLSTAAIFERTPVRGAGFDDLGLDALRVYLKRRVPGHILDRVPFEQIVERVGLASRTGAHLFPTVAGLLLFGEAPQLLHPEWGLLAVRIKGQVLSDPVIARDDVEGPLPEVLKVALNFIEENTKSIPNQLELAQRADEFSPLAVREALVNALVHRDLSSSARVAVRIFDDRLEVWSPGGLLPAHQQTLEELSNDGGISLPRNPLVAAASRVMGIGEQVGRGLPAMRRAVFEARGQPLSITSTKTEVCVVIPSALHPSRQSS